VTVFTEERPPTLVTASQHRRPTWAQPYLCGMCASGEASSIFSSSTHMLPDLSLFNIILMPTFMDEIIAAQKNDENMNHIKQRMQEGDPKVTCFHEDAEGTL
jgi:isocitrate lyase